MRIATCPGCGERIVWIRTNLNMRMPVNAHEFDQMTAEEIEAIPPGEAPVFNHKVHGSHFVTCPKADQYRRKRAKKGKPSP